jgi:hypothetical protein
MRAEDAGKMEMSQLGDLFNTLSSSEIAKFARVVESDRSAPSLPLPHDQILNILRPRLASLKPARYPTPMRQFCDPFEDLLTSGEPGDASLRISRQSLMPIWNVVSESAGKDFDDAVAEIEEGAAAGDKAKIEDAERRMWKQGAECIDRLVNESHNTVKHERALATRLGSRVHLRPIQEIGRILHVAEEIREYHHRFPTAPIRSLESPDLVWIREKFLEISTEKPGFEAVFMEGVLARLLRPSELFKVIRVLSSKTDDSMISSTNLAEIGDLVISLLAETVNEIENGLRRGKEEHEILDLARWYASEFVRITREFKIRKDGRWGEQLLQTRRRVSQAMAGTLFGASPDRVIEALPQPEKNGVKRGALPPPLFSQPFDDEKVLAAEHSAEAIAETARLAHILAAQSSATKAVIDLKKRLSQIGRSGVDSMARLEPEDHDTALRNLMATVRLLEIVDGPEEADLLRRRGMNAFRALQEKSGNGRRAS